MNEKIQNLAEKEPVVQTKAVRQSKFVPFHRAKIAKQIESLFQGQIYELKGSRKIEVWKLKSGGVAVRIYRPTDDGKTSELKFGLETDAAITLLMGLMSCLSPK